VNSEPAHSSFIGGSNAAARIACPASYQMERKLPVAAVRETSDYADEGSALHAAMADIFENDLLPDEVLGKRYAGYEDYPITQTLIDEAIKPCVDYFGLLEEEFGPIAFYVEKRVEIPALPGVFGTCDIIGKAADCSVVGDYKFGAGVQVLAWYTDENDNVVPNEQPMFYTLAATQTHPELFNMADPNWPIEIFIAQPRYREGPNFDRIRVTMQDIWDFEAKLIEAAHLAKSANPPMAKGSWCRWMACKSICPLHTGPMLDTSAISEMLAKVQLRTQLEAAVDGGAIGRTATIDWGTTYSLMLELATRLEPVISDWRTQAHAYLEEGNAIPGFKLVPKRATRKWIKPEKSVERKLARMGLTKDERMPRTLVSAPQAEKILAKEYDEKLPKGYFDAISSGTTLAPDADKRQAIEPVGDVIGALTNALAAITRQDPS
jgi:hypothetical protein